MVIRAGESPRSVTVPIARRSRVAAVRRISCCGRSPGFAGAAIEDIDFDPGFTTRALVLVDGEPVAGALIEPISAACRRWPPSASRSPRPVERGVRQ
jgi:hypothetical protein